MKTMTRKARTVGSNTVWSFQSNQDRKDWIAKAEPGKRVALTPKEDSAHRNRMRYIEGLCDDGRYALGAPSSSGKVPSRRTSEP